MVSTFTLKSMFPCDCCLVCRACSSMLLLVGMWWYCNLIYVVTHLSVVDHHLPRQFHVFEHALQLASEVGTTLCTIQFVARYVIANSSHWSISVGYMVYACIQVLVEAQIFTSGNISVANQKVVSKVQQVRYWISYSCIMPHILHSFVVLHSASPRAKPQTRAKYGCIMHCYVSNIKALFKLNHG